MNEFARIECNQDLNFLRIKSFNVNGDIPQNYADKHAETLWKKHQLINIKSLIKLENDYWKNETPFTKTCTLKNEKGEEKEYYIVLNGYAGNTNPNGSCGLHFSFILSISQNKSTLVDSLNLMPNCNSSESIKSFMLIPHEDYMTIQAVQDDEKISDKTVWISDLRDDKNFVTNQTVFSR